MQVLKLKKNEDRRLRAGHLWIFSNEVDTAATPLTGFKPGALCRVEDSRGKPLGVGYVNSSTLLSVRLLTGSAGATIDVDWFVRRIESALSLRKLLHDEPFYRLIYGESDGLPGLVVDRYGDVLVAQFTTAGMEALKPVALQALQTVMKPSGILLRNDSSMREMEGLTPYTESVGDVPDVVEILENKARFEIPLKSGQKTGWFYDQRDNRARLARYVKGARVLDVFSYIGGWGVCAMKEGAAAATCVDSSKPALEAAARNAALNGVALETVHGQALDVLKALRHEQRRFEVVIVDPPALIKRKRDLEAGAEHYAHLNRLAMELLTPEGLLVSCSCSHHMDASHLQRLLLRESRHHNRRLQILEQGAQSADHPAHPAIEETRYLKAFFCRVTQ